MNEPPDLVGSYLTKDELAALASELIAGFTAKQVLERMNQAHRTDGPVKISQAIHSKNPAWARRIVEAFSNYKCTPIRATRIDLR